MAASCGRSTQALEGMKITVALILTLLASASVAAGRPPWYRDNKQIPKDEASCHKAGGVWYTTFSRDTTCLIKYSDDGKACARATDCQSLICVVANSDNTQGTCHGESERFATFWYLDENGKAEKISVE